MPVMNLGGRRPHIEDLVIAWACASHYLHEALAAMPRGTMELEEAWAREYTYGVLRARANRAARAFYAACKEQGMVSKRDAINSGYWEWMNWSPKLCNEVGVPYPVLHTAEMRARQRDLTKNTRDHAQYAQEINSRVDQNWEAGRERHGIL